MLICLEYMILVIYLGQGKSLISQAARTMQVKPVSTCTPCPCRTSCLGKYNIYLYQQ